jgi:hypothetical protein
MLCQEGCVYTYSTSSFLGDVGRHNRIATNRNPSHAADIENTNPTHRPCLLPESHSIERHRHLTHQKIANHNYQNTHPPKYLETNPPPTGNPNPKYHCAGISPHCGHKNNKSCSTSQRQIAELPTSAQPPCGVDPQQRTLAALQKPTSPISASPPTTEPPLSRTSATLSGESADQFRTKHSSTKLHELHFAIVVLEGRRALFLFGSLKKKKKKKEPNTKKD